MDDIGNHPVWVRHFRRQIRRINIRKQFLLQLCGSLLYAAWARFLFLCILFEIIKEIVKRWFLVNSFYGGIVMRMDGFQIFAKIFKLSCVLSTRKRCFTEIIQI